MVIDFTPFTLDGDRRQLFEDGAEIHLSNKAYELLKFLIEQRPRVVTKAQLHDRLWPETFVSDATLNGVVAEVRAALGEPARGARFIRTAHGIGYAFSGEATDRNAAIPKSPASASCWLALGSREFPLKDGDNILGRDTDVEVPLTDASVSRHHARVIIRAEGATFEDLGSKNGSYVGETRVTDSVPIRDGDRLKVGSLVLTFRSLATPGSTATVDE